MFTANRSRIALALVAIGLAAAQPAIAGTRTPTRKKSGKVYTTLGGEKFRDAGKPPLKEIRDRSGRLVVSVHRVVGADGKPAVAKTFHQVFGSPQWGPSQRANGVSNQLRNLAARGQKRIPKGLGIAHDGYGSSVIMTAARGRSLASIGGLKRRPSLRSLARTMAAAAEAVGSQQRRSPYGRRQGGFVHQDLKPDHIFVEDVNAARPKVTVVDWENMSEVGIGGYPDAITPEFAAPEMWTGKPRSYAVDVYALGASMRFMVTGEAFDGRALDDAFAIDSKNQRAATQFMVDGGSVEEAGRRFPTNHLEKALRAEMARPYKAPPGLKAIIDKAMSYESADRYQTNQAFAKALRGWAVTRKR